MLCSPCSSQFIFHWIMLFIQPADEYANDCSKTWMKTELNWLRTNFAGCCWKFPFAICLFGVLNRRSFCNLVTEARICAMLYAVHYSNSCDCSLLKVCTLTWLLIVLVEGYTEQKNQKRERAREWERATITVRPTKTCVICRFI